MRIDSERIQKLSAKWYSPLSLNHVSLLVPRKYAALLYTFSTPIAFEQCINLLNEPEVGGQQKNEIGSCKMIGRQKNAT